MEHFKHPRCKGCVENASSRSEVVNPLCGDNIQLTIKVGEAPKKTQNILFTGAGCSISQASASIMTELCSGLELDKAKELSSTFRAMMQGEISEEQKQKLGDGIALEGVKNFSARIRCALLAWEALDKCVRDMEGTKGL